MQNTKAVRTGWLAAGLVLAAGGAQARGHAQAVPGTKIAFAYPAGGPVTSGQLNHMYDAALARGGEAVAAAPRPMAQAAAALPRGAERAARLHQQSVVPVPVLPAASPAYQRTFRILLNNPQTTDRWDDLILRYARKYRLDARLVKSVMAAESEFKPEAVSPSGARGLMQVMPKTSEMVGVPAAKLHSPASGIMAGAAYLAVLFSMAWRIFKLKGVRYTDAPQWVIQRVIAAYHAGPKFLRRTDYFPATRAYARKVLLFYHSKVTDIRRPVASAVVNSVPSVLPTGTLN